MATFILVHGSFHGGWCWEKVVQQLGEAGHKAFAPDLPAMGSDPTPAQDVTLATTGAFIADLARGQTGKVVLVGHSLGGIAISDAAERIPKKISGLVYVSALLMRNGDTAMDLLGGSLPDFITISEDGCAMRISADEARTRYYDRCPDGEARRALDRLGPQPLQPLRDPLVITAARFGSVPRAFVECTRDVAIPLEAQRRLHQASPCRPIYAIDTGHSPFLEDAEGLSACLLGAATSFTALS